MSGEGDSRIGPAVGRNFLKSVSDTVRRGEDEVRMVVKNPDFVDLRGIVSDRLAGVFQVFTILTT